SGPSLQVDALRPSAATSEEQLFAASFRPIPNMATTNGKTKKRRVFVVDDHPVVRDGLRGVIEQQPDLIVCGEAAEAAEALANLPSASPDLGLLVLWLAHSPGLHLLKDLVIRHAS